MNRIVLAAWVLASVSNVFAQGTVVFNNRVPGTVITHVYGPEPDNPYRALVGNSAADTPPGTQVYAGPLLSGSSWMAQLFAANGADQPESSLQPASSPPTTFRTGAAAGWVVPIQATLAGVPRDAAFATVMMFVWDNSSGKYQDAAQALTAWRTGAMLGAQSPLFNVFAIGGLPGPDPNLIGLVSFNVYLIPELSTLALVGMGSLILLSRCLKRAYP